MKYIFLILFAACSHKTVPTVIFEARIKQPKGLAKLKDTVCVQKPLEVRYGWANDTVGFIPGYSTKGYIYRVAIINDTLRIVDSFKIKIKTP